MRARACMFSFERSSTRLITDDQIMAINSSSAMDPFACKLVPFPAEELLESNLSPQVRGRPLSVIQYRIHIPRLHVRVVNESLSR